MSKVISAEQASLLIKDGQTLAVGCMGLSGWPEEVAEAMESRFLATGHPRDLYVISSSNAGDRKERGITRWGHPGMLRRWMGAHIGFAPRMSKLIVENGVEAYFIPQGVVINLWREIAAGRAGLLSKVGLGTFIDPRIEGGRLNARTTEDIFKIVNLEGEEYIFYKSFPVDVAIIRGTTADENGNLTMTKEGMLVEHLELAQATHNSGGIVIAQAEMLALPGTLNPKQVRVPGVLVDYVVIATSTDSHWQMETTLYEPSFSGELRIPLKQQHTLPLSLDKAIARRAAMELKPNALVNLGVGIPAVVAAVAEEEGVSKMVNFSTEAGVFGGVPATGQNFGASYNLDACIEAGAMFDLIDGGGLDITFLGLGQADKFGNLNVTKLGGKPMGPGGFINITRKTKKLVFVGSFTAGGLEVEIGDGRIRIAREGRINKFVDKVAQVTFAGQSAAGRPVLYVTERCVFSLENGTMTLIEIAPGIDLQKDVLDRMGFSPAISPDLKRMPGAIFQEQWEELKGIVENKRHSAAGQENVQVDSVTDR